LARRVQCVGPGRGERVGRRSDGALAPRVEENTAAEGIDLSAEQIARLSNLTPATGERHNEANLSTIDR
jgi:hypothetical protein